MCLLGLPLAEWGWPRKGLNDRSAGPSSSDASWPSPGSCDGCVGDAKRKEAGLAGGQLRRGSTGRLGSACDGRQRDLVAGELTPRAEQPDSRRLRSAADDPTATQNEPDACRRSSRSHALPGRHRGLTALDRPSSLPDSEHDAVWQERHGRSPLPLGITRLRRESPAPCVVAAQLHVARLVKIHDDGQSADWTNVSRSASRTCRATSSDDCGFWPVTTWPSRTAKGCQFGAASNLAPS